MNKLKYTQVISLKIILLFSVAILSTFVGDYLHDFFGDWKCTGSGQRLEDSFRYYQKCNYADNGFHDAMWHWGYRHWLYLLMCITLFGVQVYEIVNYKSKN